MEPEGVVDVLRRLLRSLVPGGIVVDLLSVPPPERVEAAGEVLGELDGSAFFPQAAAAAAGLDELARAALLEPLGEERFPVFIRYPTGRDLFEDVAQRELTRMPERLGRRVLEIDGPCEIRDNCLVRSFRLLEPAAPQK
jgi:hypothetical protein